MNKLIAFAVAFAVLAAFSTSAFAGRSRPYKDAYGNSYSNPNNLYNDRDGDGVIGMYDRRDDDSSRTYW